MESKKTTNKSKKPIILNSDNRPTQMSRANKFEGRISIDKDISELSSETDPFGSYTGKVAGNEYEKPMQDADDL